MGIVGRKRAKWFQRHPRPVLLLVHSTGSRLEQIAWIPSERGSEGLEDEAAAPQWVLWWKALVLLDGQQPSLVVTLFPMDVCIQIPAGWALQFHWPCLTCEVFLLVQNLIASSDSSQNLSIWLFLKNSCEEHIHTFPVGGLRTRGCCEPPALTAVLC